MSRWLKEPLIHFLALGALIFALHDMTAGKGREAGQVIFITAVLAASIALKRVPRPRWAWRVPVYAIGSLAAFRTIQRISGFA